MALLVHAYQLEGRDVYSLMVALRQLNTVEEAEEDIHEVCQSRRSVCTYCHLVYLQLVEAYATVIECCQAFHLLTLSNFYAEKALSKYVQYTFSAVIHAVWLQSPRHSVLSR